MAGLGCRMDHGSDTFAIARKNFSDGRFIADIGSLLPSVISGSAIVAVVLSLQTSGPMLLDALRSQDQYLAGSFLMFLALLAVIGTFISDLLLAVLDPRIRLTGGVAK